MKSLHEQTLALLDKSKLPIGEIAEKSKLPYDWLISVKYRRIKNPSVDRIQRLYEFLNGRRLKL